MQKVRCGSTKLSRYREISARGSAQREISVEKKMGGEGKGRGRKRRRGGKGKRREREERAKEVKVHSEGHC
jgi:hypothetical protein